MDPWTRYVIATWLYVLCAATGAVLAALFTIRQQWFLVVICALFALVALDNVFCASHLRTAGCPVRGHYAIPLRRRQ
jgi:hypothetical protein